jgi:hypothetical protein
MTKNPIRLCSLFAAVLLCAAACEQSTQDISETVKTSMQEKFDSDSQFKQWHLTVKSVDVVHQNGNSYRGLAHVTYNGADHDVGVEITADGRNVLWQAPPGSFLFVAEDELKNLKDN